MPTLAEQQAKNAQHTDDGPLSLVTIEHPDIIGGPLRIVKNNEDVTSRGNVYTAIPTMSITKHPIKVGDTPKARLVIHSAPTLVLQTLLKTATPRPVVTLEEVLFSDPDTVVGVPQKNLEWQKVGMGGTRVTGFLSKRDRGAEPAQKGRFDTRFTNLQ